MDLKTKAHIIANLAIEKGKRLDEIDIPEEIKHEVYNTVGYKKVETGEIDEGIDILIRAREKGGENFERRLINIAVEKIRKKEISQGFQIFDRLKSLNPKLRYEEHINSDELISITKMTLKDNKLEEGFKLLDMLTEIDDKDFYQEIGKIGFEKIKYDQVDVGIAILRKIREISNGKSLKFIEDFIYNYFKNGNIDIAVRIIDEVKPFKDTSYIQNIFDIGYRMIARNNIKDGEKIVMAMSGRGVPIDKEILELLGD